MHPKLCSPRVTFDEFKKIMLYKPNTAAAK